MTVAPQPAQTNAIVSTILLLSVFVSQRSGNAAVNAGFRGTTILFNKVACWGTSLPANGGGLVTITFHLLRVGDTGGIPRLARAAMSVGGFLGLGSKEHPIPLPRPGDNFVASAASA
jgi:hypothetical protein